MQTKEKGVESFTVGAEHSEGEGLLGISEEDIKFKFMEFEYERSLVHTKPWIYCDGTFKEW